MRMPNPTPQRKGLTDWFIQRITSVVILAYVVFLIVFLAANPGLDFDQWSQLHSHLIMKTFSLLTIVSVALHSWIGIWCVLTDYITDRLVGPKADFARKILQSCVALLATAYVIWAIKILWGI